jgi:glutamate carboxypeptidase
LPRPTSPRREGTEPPVSPARLGAERLEAGWSQTEESWIRALRGIVDIDSGPGDRDGIDRVYDQLTEHLVSIGFSVRRQGTAGPDVLIAARSPTATPTLRILLLGHADTVFGSGTARERPFALDGNAISGPGVADMKGGLIVLLAGLSMALPHLDSLGITLIVNGDEESGSVDSRDVIVTHARTHDLALVFEPGDPPNAVVTSRQGAYRFEVEVSGRAAHTGVNPAEGANAIEAAAHVILEIQALGRSLPNAHVNAVMISGGTRPNVVPDLVRIRVDTRFRDKRTEADIVAAINALAGPGAVAGTLTAIRSLDRRPAFETHPNTEMLTSILERAALDLSQELDVHAGSGSSDANFTAAAGLPTIDGLGVVGSGFHSADERALLSSLKDRALLFAKTLETLSR